MSAQPTVNRTLVLVLLTSVYFFSVVDRQIMAILLQPIKDDLGLSDTELGFLSGTAFALFYATLGLPLGRYADRINHRNRLITFALFLFSLMTFVSGLAANFMQLLFARIGVAIGEAGTSPPSHSMLSDLYAPSERAMAMAVLTVGANIAIVIGFVVGGIVAALYTWRMAFMVLGGTGVVLALFMVWLLIEPRRRQDAGSYNALTNVSPSIQETLRFLWRQRSYFHLLIGSSLALFVGLGLVSWLPSYFHRSFNMNVRDAGITLGIMIGVGSAIGTLLSGYLADRLGRKDARWRVRIIGIVVSLTIPFHCLLLMAETETQALLALLIPAVTISFFQAPAFAVAQELSQMRMRAMTSAIILFTINMIGLGLGPQLIGIVSDVLGSSYGDESLRYALFLVLPIGVWAAVHFFLASRTLLADIQHARFCDTKQNSNLTLQNMN